MSPAPPTPTACPPDPARTSRKPPAPPAPLPPPSSSARGTWALLGAGLIIFLAASSLGLHLGVPRAASGPPCTPTQRRGSGGFREWDAGSWFRVGSWRRSWGKGGAASMDAPRDSCPSRLSLPLAAVWRRDWPGVRPGLPHRNHGTSLNCGPASLCCASGIWG